MIPAQVKIREDVYYAYSCQRCKKESTETPVVKEKKSPAVIPGSYASPEAIARITPQGALSCRYCGNSPCGTEVCDGLPVVPAGAGVEPGRGKIIPADDE